MEIWCRYFLLTWTTLVFSPVPSTYHIIVSTCTQVLSSQNRGTSSTSMHEYLTALNTTLFFVVVRNSPCDDSFCNYQPRSKGNVAGLHEAEMQLLPATCRITCTWVKSIKTTRRVCFPASALQLQHFIPLRRACSDKKRIYLGGLFITLFFFL